MAHGGAMVTMFGDPIRLTDFSSPWLFTYLSRQEGVVFVEGGKSRLTPADGRGGGGYNIQPALDLTSLVKHTPMLTLEIRPGNRAKAIRLMLRLGNDSGTGVFDLSAKAVGTVVTLFPVSAAVVGAPPTRQGKFNLAAVSQVQVQGDRSEVPLDVVLSSADIRRPREQARAEWTAELQRQTRALEAEKKVIDAASATIRHTTAGVRISHVATVSTDLLRVPLVDGELQRSAIQPHLPQPGDKIVDEGRVWVDPGGTVKQALEKRTLRRVVGGSEQDVGYITTGSDGKNHLWPYESRTGKRVEEKTLALPY